MCQHIVFCNNKIEPGASRNGYRKPIKNPFSDQSDSSDSDL